MTGVGFFLLTLATALSGLGAALALGAARSGRRPMLGWARLLSLGAALTGLALLAAVGVREHRFPVGNVAEGFVFFAVATLAAALAIDALRGLPVLVVGAAPLAFSMLLVAAALTLAPAAPSGGTRDSSIWTHLHIFVALGSFGAFALAFVTGILYLVEQRQLKEHSGASLLGLMPALETVARLNVRALATGVVLLTAGLLMGYLRARNVLEGPAWRMDPKILLTTATLAVYLFVLIASARPAFKGRRTALGSVVGFFLTLTTFWASVFWTEFHQYR